MVKVGDNGQFDLATMARDYLAQEAAQAAAAQTATVPATTPAPSDMPSQPELGPPIVAPPAVTAPITPTTPAPAATPTPLPSGTYLRDYLREQVGIELDDEITDEHLAPRIAETLGELQALRTQLEELRQRDTTREGQLNEYLSNLPEFQQFRDTRRKQQATEQAAEAGQAQSKPKWEPLQYDPDWELAVEFDAESRRWVPKPKYGTYGIEAAENLNKVMRAQAERARRLTSDPWGVVLEAGAEDYFGQLRKEVDDKLESLQKTVFQTLQQQQSAEEVKQSRNQWLDEHAKELFVTDEEGNYKTNRRGDLILTPRGQVYQEEFHRAQQLLGLKETDADRQHPFGMSALQAADRLAALSISATPTPQAAAAPQPAAPVPIPQPLPPQSTAAQRNEQRKQEYLDRGFVTANPRDSLVNRDGSLLSADANGEPQDKHLSFSELARILPENAEHLGVHFKG